MPLTTTAAAGRLAPSHAEGDATSLGTGAGRHVVALDGLRGVAILFVMVFHYVTPFVRNNDSFVTRQVLAGTIFMWTGVDLFFVLSGFLITGILLGAKAAPGYFTNFYMRRVLRIFPLYYGALAVLFLVVPCFVAIDTPAVKRIYDTQFWEWAYAQNIAMAIHGDYFNAEWLWIGHFWSLAVEEHFYLVWPLLVFVCSRRALLRTTIGVMVATPLLRVAMYLCHVDVAAAFALTVSRTDELAAGGLVAILAQNHSYERLAWLARRGLAAGSVYVLAVVVATRKPFWCLDWTTLTFGFSALALGFASLVVFATSPQRNVLRRVVESRFLVTFGKYSYGAYVLHIPMEPVYLRYFAPDRLAALTQGLGHTGSRLVGLVGFAALGIAFTMGLAMVTFFVYERPFLRLKRYFEYGRAARRPAAAASAT